MIKFDTAVHSYPFLFKTRAFFVDWTSVHSVEASDEKKNTLESFENEIFMNSVSGNNPSYLLLKSMASKRITFLSQFCLTLYQTK